MTGERGREGVENKERDMASELRRCNGNRESGKVKIPSYLDVVKVQVEAQLGFNWLCHYAMVYQPLLGEIRAELSTSGSWSKERDWHRKRELAENAGAKGDRAEVDCESSPLRSRYHSTQLDI